MSYDVEFAKMLKERNNKKAIGAITGKVVSVNPFKISIFDGQILLKKEQLYFCNSILDNYIREYQTSEINTEQWGSTQKIKLTDTLKVDDEVMLIAAENGQTFFAIDKVVKL
ncbi:hypothetical protein CLTEP_02200 [Clostridium tepidiprofundi DSM 19306]|uniref:DUF2577 domain-containing protein n=1 Tax=Clostridium tepidiprofundi DSM 19306 TaxID=1121338 RepID=A0A151B850_9CLOT|nr:DUF2577 family protein [Clostridium tepidiprofundi]KYH35827.1 hypothetical protein CLTEP_02200 [Clostridium tepidiprofundi DSM 19306]